MYPAIPVIRTFNQAHLTSSSARARRMSKKHVGIIQHPQASVCTLLMRTEREHITSGHGPIDGKTGKRSNNAAAPWHKPADLKGGERTITGRGLLSGKARDFGPVFQGLPRGKTRL